MTRPVSPDAFAAELLASAVQVLPAAALVVKKAAQNIKDESRANVLASAPTHNARAHNAITYDEPQIGPTSVRSEVGYDKTLPGGSLGNLLEYGGGGDHSPPHMDINRATDAEEPRFADAIHKLSGRLL